jgi:hypothetical protein
MTVLIKNTPIMKTTLRNTGLALCLCLIVALSAKAQDINDAKNLKDKTPAQRAQYQTGLMKSKLTLDSIQLVKVQAINLKYAQQFDKVLKSDDAKMSRIKQARSLQKNKDAELKAVFTATQYKQYEAIENELMTRVKDNVKNLN